MTPKLVVLDEFDTMSVNLQLQAYTNQYGRTYYRVCDGDDPFHFLEYLNMECALAMFLRSVDQYR